MKQLIYRSQPFGFDQAMLAGILSDARRCNERDNITGALLCRHDLYLQLIEGPELAIDAAYARISRDHRHCEVNLLFSDTASERMFPHWRMLDDQSPSLAWSAEAVAGGALEAADREDLLAVFQKLAARTAIPDASGS